jgi:hypothetical protein
VLGIPFRDPEGVIASGQVLEELDYHDTEELTVGATGIFLVRTPENVIWFYVIEKGGRYPCVSDLEFPGLNMDELAQLVLSDDCWKNARQLGIESKCSDVEFGCCGLGTTHYHESAALVVVLGVLRSRKKRLR